MALTFAELKERLVERLDVLDLLEILDISAEDLVDAFPDRIEARFEILVEQVENDYEEN